VTAIKFTIIYKRRISGLMGLKGRMKTRVISVSSATSPVNKSQVYEVAKSTHSSYNKYL
jgi:hypothetical protein